MYMPLFLKFVLFCSKDAESADFCRKWSAVSGCVCKCAIYVNTTIVNDVKGNCLRLASDMPPRCSRDAPDKIVVRI